MALADPILISMNDVCRLTSLSRAAVLRLLEADKFPPKIDLGTGRRFAFNRKAVLAWIDERMAEADRRKVEAIAAAEAKYAFSSRISAETKSEIEKTKAERRPSP